MAQPEPDYKAEMRTIAAKLLDNVELHKGAFERDRIRDKITVAGNQSFNELANVVNMQLCH